MMPEITEQPAINLKSLLQDFPAVHVNKDILVSGITLDSRNIKVGDVFCAIQGTSHNGLSFAQSAIEAGAKVILHQAAANDILRRSAEQANVLLVHDPKLSQHLSRIAGRFYSEPSKQLNIIGITGTDGKTSVSHYVAQCLEELSSVPNQKCGVIGTLGYGQLQELQLTGLTTPDAVAVQAALAEFLAKGMNNVVMEVSSHGLEQGRVAGVDFNIAVLTNLSRDHLDYHKNMEQYKAAKRRLFESYRLSAAVINASDEFGVELLKRFSSRYPIYKYKMLDSYSGSSNENLNHNIIGSDLVYDENGFTMQVHTHDGEFSIKSNLLGYFNALNLLSVIAVLQAMEYDMLAIKVAIEKLQGVAGRMQRIHYPGLPTIIIDYAHTPKALESALRAIRAHCMNKVWCVFGCGGNRDTGKRPLMGKVAELLADQVILTNDNPRYEDPDSILKQIIAGIKNSEAVLLIQNRQEAIETAIKNASAGDWVLISGKGHEGYQDIKGNKTPFNDFTVVNNIASNIR